MATIEIRYPQSVKDVLARLDDLAALCHPTELDLVYSAKADVLQRAIPAEILIAFTDADEAAAFRARWDALADDRDANHRESDANHYDSEAIRRDGF